MAVGERQRRKMPSFSSSLLDAIYHSIDEQPHPQRRNVDDEIESLRRAIMVEKWMENYSHTARARARARPTHLPSNSSSSTDSIFTSSETDTPKPERTKSLKKVKEPVSPAARIANFLNSIFSLKKDHPVRKSRSMKDSAATASRSCLTTSSAARNINKSNSKRCVRFLHQDTTLIYKNNIERDFDDKSCASSDLFELENIIDQELPVYGTTDLKINRAIASGFKMY